MKITSTFSSVRQLSNTSIAERYVEFLAAPLFEKLKEFWPQFLVRNSGHVAVNVCHFRRNWRFEKVETAFQQCLHYAFAS